MAEGSGEAACRILAVVLQPTLPEAGDNGGYQRREPESRLATWDLRDTVERLSPIVLALGEPGLDVVEQSLDQTLELTGGAWVHEREDDSQYWCPDIETHAADYADHLLAHLVSLTRDTALRLVDSRRSSLSKIVTSFEERRWGIFRRLALFLLHKHPSGSLDLVAARLVDRSCFDLPGPEYARLLRSNFAHLHENQRRTILSWIDHGPEFLAPSDTSGYADRWKMGWLRTIADALPEAWRSKHEALKAQVGDVPAVDEVPSRDTLFIGPTSPFRNEALAQMTPAELVTKMQSWPPSSEFGSPEPEGLSRTLASLVEQKPDTYAVATEDLKRLDPTYLRGFLNGLGSAALAGHVFDWKPVVDLCAWIVSRPRQISGRKETPFGFDAHWGHARHHVLLLLSKGLTSSTAPIPVELRSTVWSAIEPTLYDPDDAEGLGRMQDRPMDHLLNRVQGLAMVTMVEYALWVAKGTSAKGLPAEVKAALEKKLQAGSVAVRVALADRIGTMAYLDSSWTESHLRTLFKPNEEGRDLAWETYLHYERLTLDVFHLLRWRYGAAVDELRPEAELNHRSQELVHRVANNLGQLYWHGQLGFGERDKLLNRFFADAPAKITGKLIKDFGRWLHIDGQPTQEVLARLKALWARREAVGRLEELAEFGWWFSSGCFDEGWAVDNFLRALEKLDGTTLSPQYAPKLGERLAELIPQHLAKAASCLELLVKANESGWAILDLRSAAWAILTACKATGDAGLQRVAKATIGRLVRRNYLEFLDLR